MTLHIKVSEADYLAFMRIRNSLPESNKYSHQANYSDTLHRLIEAYGVFPPVRKEDIAEFAAYSGAIQ